MSERSEGEVHVQAMRLTCEALEDREEGGLEVDWDVINQQLDQMDVILQGIADQRSDDAEEIQTLRKERDAAEAEISKLMTQLSADAVRQELEEFKAKNFELVEKIRAAAGHVDLMEDSNRNLRAEVETLKTQLDDARVATLNAQGLLDAARAETVEVRRRLNEETDRHRATNSEKIDLFQKLEWANKNAAELVAERDAALAAVTMQRAGIERLNAFVGKVRSVIDNDCDGLEIDEMIEALAELNAGTEPAPATEAAPCPECERLQLAMNESDERLTNFMRFVAKVRPLVNVPRRPLYPTEIDFVRAALAELDASTTATTEAEGWQ